MAEVKENWFGIYTIHDKVAQENGPIFEAKNNGVALRSYHGLLAGDAGLFKDEYQLIKIGELNKSTGEIFVLPSEVIESPEIEIKEK